MIYKDTESNIRPSKVLIERLPLDNNLVRLADNIREVETDGGIIYRYDESVFNMKGDITESEIKAGLNEFWKRGEDPDDEKGHTYTLEELSELAVAHTNSIAMFEDCLIEMSEMIYA